MKKSIFILLLAISMFNCSKDDDNVIPEETIQEATLVGRWNVVGFESAVLYEFTESERFTMYSSDSEFESLEAVIASGRHGNDWTIEGDKVTIDLHFGNFSTNTIEYACGNNVIHWLNDNDEVVSTIFREGFDYASCNE